MTNNEPETKLKLLPKEARLLDLYFKGVKHYLCAKLAGYKAKSKSALGHTTKRIVKKYISEASKDDLSKRAGAHSANWFRDLQWAKRKAKAKGDVKSFLTALKLQGEAIGVLKASLDELEKGATIYIGTTQQVEEAKKSSAKKVEAMRGKVVNMSFPDDD